MSELNPESLSCTELLKRAMQAHWPAEKSMENLAKQLAQPVRMLHLPSTKDSPNGKSVALDGITDRQAQSMIAGALQITMQTQRLMFAALEGMAIQIESMKAEPELPDCTSDRCEMVVEP